MVIGPPVVIGPPIGNRLGIVLGLVIDPPIGIGIGPDVLIRGE